MPFPLPKGGQITGRNRHRWTGVGGGMEMGHTERSQLLWTAPCEKQKRWFPYGQGEGRQAFLGLLGAVIFLLIG